MPSTKEDDSEASRTKEDEEIDEQGEIDSEGGRGEVSNMRQRQLQLQGWEDYNNSVLDHLYRSGQMIPASGNRSFFEGYSIVDTESDGEQSISDDACWEEKEDKAEQHDGRGSVLSIDEENTPGFEEANGCGSGEKQSVNDDNLLGQQGNGRFVVRECEKMYYDSDGLESDGIECDSTDSEVGAIVISKRSKGKRRRVEDGSSSDVLDPDIIGRWDSDSVDDSSDSKDDVDSGDSSNEVDGGNRKRAYYDEDKEAELRKKMRFCMDQE
ncbi:hypothetical protein BGZ98_001415 [Dissophora globulifera]|nr:hypothetical protein BGZ98_001415 [Dissophora globulifera]